MSTEYEQIMSTNSLYEENKTNWDYFLRSFMGGKAYKEGGYLTPYTKESETEYQKRLNGTYLDNHCNSVISVYNSFLFREQPTRDLGQLSNLEETQAFMKDADLEGRSLNSFMKDVATWSAVFGHCWVIVAKPNINAGTRAEELAQSVRPYVSIQTPLTVLHWTYERLPNGLYILSYLKYVEENEGPIQVIKEWTNEFIITTTVDTDSEQVVSTVTENNELLEIPAVIAYANRSIKRGIGVSDINDVADVQRYIYNNNSEAEQSIRIDSHPILSKTKDTQVNAGAGAIATMPDDLDPGLKPFMIQTSGADISSVLLVIERSNESIDKMSNTGAIRSTQTKVLSGIAMETEFQLLNARLSEKADNLELAEEQMWRLFASYQDKAWDGEVMYPDSFNIRDANNEMVLLENAKKTTEDPNIIKVIDTHLTELLGEDPNEILNKT